MPTEIKKTNFRIIGKVIRKCPSSTNYWECKVKGAMLSIKKIFPTLEGFIT